MTMDTLEVVITRVEQNIKWIQKEFVKLKKKYEDENGLINLEKVYKMDSLIQHVQKELGIQGKAEQESLKKEAELSRNKLIRECHEKRVFVKLNRIPILDLEVTTPEKEISAGYLEVGIPNHSLKRSSKTPLLAALLEGESILPDLEPNLEESLKAASYDVDLDSSETDDTEYESSLPDRNVSESPKEFPQEIFEEISIGPIKIEGVEQNMPEPANKPETRGRKPSSFITSLATKIQDKKLRKKIQNNSAATTYRKKKKIEILTLLEQEEKLEREQQKLLNQVKLVTSKIHIIKPILLACMLNKTNPKS